MKQWAAIVAYATGISVVLVLAITSGPSGAILFALICFLCLVVALVPSDVGK